MRPAQPPIGTRIAIRRVCRDHNRIHPAERVEQSFENVPVSPDEDVTITIRPAGDKTYSLSPFPFAAQDGEFAFCGRRITPDDGSKAGGWPAALKQLPTEWECFRLVAT